MSFISADDDCDSWSCHDCCDDSGLTVFTFYSRDGFSHLVFGVVVACYTPRFETTDPILARSSFIFLWTFSAIVMPTTQTSMRGKNGMDLAMIEGTEISDWPVSGWPIKWNGLSDGVPH